MKKMTAVLLALLLVLSLSVPVFAADSPGGQKMVKIVFVDGADDKVGTTYTCLSGEELTLKASSDKGKFDGFMFYTANGKPAVEGTDYTVVSNTDAVAAAYVVTEDVHAASAPVYTKPVITFAAHVSLIVTANYNGVITTPTISNDDDEAPATGDNTAVYLSAIAFVALCGVVVAKKQLAK